MKNKLKLQKFYFNAIVNEIKAFEEKKIMEIFLLYFEMATHLKGLYGRDEGEKKLDEMVKKLPLHYQNSLNAMANLF